MMDVQIINAIYESIRTKQSVPIVHRIEKKRPGLHQEIRRPAHEEPEIVHAHPPSRAA